MNELIIAPQTSLLEIRRDTQTFPRLKAYTQQDAVRMMTRMVFLAAAYRGYNVDKEQIAFIATTLYMDLMQDEERLGTDTITFAEIGRVFRKAELFGLSVKGLYDAIIAYIMTEGKKAAEEARKAKAERMRKEDEEKLQEIRRRYAAMMEEANHERQI